jgi:hypothetical protein
MKKRLVFGIVIVVALVLAVAVPAIGAGGFDQYGYNNTARIFNGAADGVDRTLDGAVWGDPTYANDKLVMKWNAEWDRGNAEGWTKPPYAAWEDNEWNGKAKGGSGQIWHYKIIWFNNVNSLPDFAALPDGGYVLWGQFEVIMDQGFDPNVGPGHLWYAHAKPTGYGLAGK